MQFRFWARADTEKRNEHVFREGYTAGILRAAEEQAQTGWTDQLPAYVESAIGAISRPFLGATASLPSVSGRMLSEAVYGMIVGGLAAYLIEITRGELELVPVKIEERKPGQVRIGQKWVSADDVVIFEWPYNLAKRQSTLKIACELERALYFESVIPTGRLIALSQDIEPGDAGDLISQVGQLKGRTMGLPSTPGTSGEKTTWRPEHIGPAPSEGLLKARDRVRADILAKLGVPPGILEPSDAGQAAREIRHLFEENTVHPIRDALGMELAEKVGDCVIELPVPVADIQIRARTVSSLMQQGVPLDQAKEIAGLS